jgi:hypothetical protein
MESRDRANVLVIGYFMQSEKQDGENTIRSTIAPLSGHEHGFLSDTRSRRHVIFVYVFSFPISFFA